MNEFKMPSLGADMEAGTLIEWLVKVGDAVKRGDVVAVVETHKGVIEIEIFDTGIVDSLLVHEGEKVPVGTVMARIRSSTDVNRSGEPKPEVARPDVARPDVAAVTPAAQSMPKPLPPSAPKAVGDPIAASPAARKRAQEANIDLKQVQGSGPNGAILLHDVDGLIARSALQPAAKPAARPGTKPGLDMASMRAAIAAAMSRSKREIPHYYLGKTIDLQVASDWLSKQNAGREPEQRLLMGALFLRATVLAAAKAPELNGRFENGAFTPASGVNIGLVVALREGGLIAPAIMDAQTLSLDQLMIAMRDVVERARKGRLRNSEVTQGSLTVSSLGETGADTLYGVIYPPQVGIVGFGVPSIRPFVNGQEIQPRLLVDVTVAADHRVSDGRRGSQLITEIERCLLKPETL